MISGTDEDENTSRFEYYALNRLVKTTDARGWEVKRIYDDRGNLIEIQDPNQGITWYEYDLNNRLVKVIRPMLQESAYAYDEIGNRTAVLDSKGQKIAYEYNELNRLTKVLYYKAGDHDNAVKTVDFNYDKLGNLTFYEDGTTSATYEYDDLQRKIRETVDYGLFSKSIEYTYYANGLKKTFTGPDGVTISYSYDENNRLTSVAMPDQGQATYVYDRAHWNSPAGKLMPGGSREDYSYDPLMQIKSIIAKDPGQNPLMTRDYTYSAAGNISAKNTEHGNYQYQYDELQRLTEAVNPLGTDEAYTYDPLGNRLTAGGVSGNWSYNANNELEGYYNVAFVYDDNGNTIRKSIGTQEFNYAYDVEDRLIRVDDGLDIELANYYYDPFGRRLYKEVDGTQTYFVYSNEGLIGEYDETGAEIRSYGWMPDSQWSTDPLFYKQQGQYYWYQNDHLGTPQKIIETSGKVVWSAVYDSFGNVQIETAEIVNNLRFAGQYFDAETGLYYNLNRYYDPAIGRYLRTDPYGDGLNLYAYVFNNPVNLIDPLGLCALKAAWEYRHEILAVVGLIPAVGIVPDLIDAGLYLLEAEYGDAALAGIAAIPLVGYGGRAVQYGIKGVKKLLQNEKVISALKSAWRIIDNKIGAVGDIGDLRRASKNVRFSGTAKKSKWSKASQNDKGPGLRDHFEKHGDQVGAKSVGEYDISARNTIQQGKRFKYRDPTTNEPRVGYYDKSTGLFTATSQTGKTPTILTHYPLSETKVKKLPGYTWD